MRPTETKKDSAQLGLNSMFLHVIYPLLEIRVVSIGDKSRVLEIRVVYFYLHIHTNLRVNQLINCVLNRKKNITYSCFSLINWANPCKRILSNGKKSLNFLYANTSILGSGSFYFTDPDK